MRARRRRATWAPLRVAKHSRPAGGYVIYIPSDDGVALMEELRGGTGSQYDPIYPDAPLLRGEVGVIDSGIRFVERTIERGEAEKLYPYQRAMVDSIASGAKLRLGPGPRYGKASGLLMVAALAMLAVKDPKR